LKEGREQGKKGGQGNRNILGDRYREKLLKSASENSPDLGLSERRG